MLAAAVLAAWNAHASETVTDRDCRERLSEIEHGKMSADDTPVLSNCAMNGFISAGDIERAYERAKKARQ
ncbi:hypothetical protein ATC00_02515 [Sinorhizobium americanum]|nr:hypothetical protein ATC00_02515 [Sinorhizobium americanum]